MPRILAEIPSSSDPRKKYKITEGDDGVTYCECWQWKRTRNCKHLELFRRKAYPTEQEPEAHEIPEDGSYDALINDIVKDLRTI